MHAIAAQVEISLVQGTINKETNKLVKATFLKPGEKGVCHIKVQSYLFRSKDLFASRNMNLCLP